MFHDSALFGWIEKALQILPRGIAIFWCKNLRHDSVFHNNFGEFRLNFVHLYRTTRTYSYVRACAQPWKRKVLTASESVVCRGRDNRSDTSCTFCSLIGAIWSSATWLYFDVLATKTQTRINTKQYCRYQLDPNTSV